MGIEVFILILNRFNCVCSYYRENPTDIPLPNRNPADIFAKSNRNVVSSNFRNELKNPITVKKIMEANANFTKYSGLTIFFAS